MADLAHWWSNDLSTDATGDILSVNGLVRGQQRVLRRLLTSPGEYFFEPSYGAGLPARIGSPLGMDTLAAIIRAQIFLEPAVARTPPPVITVTPLIAGFFVEIQYTDADTGQRVPLSFDVTP